MKNKDKDKETYTTVADGLWRLYKQKLQPMEVLYKYNEFHSPLMEKGDFDAKPMVLLIGQYSTGKTTFIRYLIGGDYPGLRIGPEPTTDTFTAVMHGERDQIIPGNVAAMDTTMQFRPLSRFGSAFLSRFKCCQTNKQVLESITLIDTPGVLSGEKQRLDRGYDFAGVLEWFADRVDLILLLFDAHKLDISDEFKRVIESIKGSYDKTRIVLNKADHVDAQQLMRVYGALMWNLGKILISPEVTRVYIGSFWDQKLVHGENRRLFEMEQNDLFKELSNLPRNAVTRKLNDFLRRVNSVKVHAHVISVLKSEMPTLIGRDSKKQSLLANLESVYEKISQKHGISLSDFPAVKRMQELLPKYEFQKFAAYQSRVFNTVDELLNTDVAKLMQLVPKEQRIQAESTSAAVKGGAFENVETPFSLDAYQGINRGLFDGEWVVEKARDKWSKLFEELKPINGKISGEVARNFMLKSQLPNSTLRHIWILSDIDKDGCLDEDEFCLVCHLTQLKLDGEELPNTLPAHLVPPSKREPGAIQSNDRLANGYELTY